MDPRSIQTSATYFRSCRAFIAIIIVLLCITPSFLFSQATGGSVQGRILDENGQPLPGASITATHKLTGGTRTVTSDDSGFYRISELKVGAYEFTVALSGFATQVRSGVNILVGQQAQLHFTMKVATVEESIVVDEDVPVIEPTKTSIGATITKQQIDDLPLQNRDFVNLAFLAPGITFARTEATDISGSGSTGSSNTFLIDGLSNDQDAVGDSRGDFSPDAISEFQVMSSSYNAEYGQATGAVINVISRTGTNDYHGRVSTFYRADGLSASNPFGRNTPFDETIVGGTFGGPIVKNKTFFFGSYEHTFLNDTAVVAVDPQLLASLGLSTQTTVDQPLREPRLLLKLDQHFSENNSLTVRYRLDNRKRENDSVGDSVSGTAVLTEEGGFTFKTKDQDFAVSDNWILSDTMLNEARFQFAREDNDLVEPNCPGCPFILRPTVASGKIPNQPQTVREDRYEFLDALSFNLPGKAGDHYFKAGFDFSHIALSAFLPQNFDGVFIFNTDQPFDPADQNTYPFIYQVGSGNPNIDINNNVVALYFQDQWNVTPNLTFNLGIRWDYEDHIMIKGDHNDFGPRLHFAWDPFKKGTTSIRGGYGRYYDQIFLNAPLISSIFEPGRFNSQTILFPGYPDPYVGGAQIPFPLPPSESILDPNAQTPSKDVATAGFQHAITHDMAITADYVYAKSHNLLVLINSNQPINGVLPHPDVGIIYGITTAGRATYNALQVGLQKRFGSRYSLNLAYTLASNKTNAHGSQSFASNAYDIEADFGPSDDDIRNTLTVAGLYDGPWGLKIGASTAYLSSPPFNVVTGGDENGDGQLNDRPAGVPYNSMRGDPLWTVNARLAKVFNISQTRLEVLIEAFNLFNRENVGNFNGNILSPDFGQPTGLVDNFPPRQVQLGVRFDF
jgi:outer membrane receptor for ferrienterochelin and colicin